MKKRSLSGYPARRGKRKTKITTKTAGEPGQKETIDLEGPGRPGEQLHPNSRRPPSTRAFWGKRKRRKTIKGSWRILDIIIVGYLSLLPERLSKTAKRRNGWEAQVARTRAVVKTAESGKTFIARCSPNTCHPPTGSWRPNLGANNNEASSRVQAGRRLAPTRYNNTHNNIMWCGRRGTSLRTNHYYWKISYYYFKNRPKGHYRKVWNRLRRAMRAHGGTACGWVNTGERVLLEVGGREVTRTRTNEKNKTKNKK